MESNSQGRVALVTGGSRGIGRGIVHALASQAYSVVVNYRSDRQAAEETCRQARELGAPEAIAIGADIANLSAGRALLEESHSRLGRLDLLVNNAGVAPEVRADLLEATPESWDRVLGINLRGVYFLTQSAARIMIHDRRQGLVREPRIIFITSVSSSMASVSRGEYCVAKAGLSMAAKLFALRLAAEGVLVHEIRPGLIETSMTAPVKQAYDDRIAAGLVPLGRWGTPDDVGHAVAQLAKGALPYATGSVLEIDGGLHLERL